MTPGGDEPRPFDDRGGWDPTPPEEGFELYRHKSAERMRTRSWHGHYWARQNEEGDYEIRSVPSTLGEHSVPAGVMPKEGFEKYYEKAGA